MRTVSDLRRLFILSAGVLPALLPLPSYSDSQDGRLQQGRAVFKQRCMVCHGEQADGNSNLGQLMQPHPANLLRSTLSDQERERIVRQGGAAVGRSSSMPSWQTELSDVEIAAVVAYVGSLRQQ